MPPSPLFQTGRRTHDEYPNVPQRRMARPEPVRLHGGRNDTGVRGMPGYGRAVVGCVDVEAGGKHAVDRHGLLGGRALRPLLRAVPRGGSGTKSHARDGIGASSARGGLGAGVRGPGVPSAESGGIATGPGGVLRRATGGGGFPGGLRSVGRGSRVAGVPSRGGAANAEVARFLPRAAESVLAVLAACLPEIRRTDSDSETGRRGDVFGGGCGTVDGVRSHCDDRQRVVLRRCGSAAPGCAGIRNHSSGGRTGDAPHVSARGAWLPFLSPNASGGAVSGRVGRDCGGMGACVSESFRIEKRRGFQGVRLRLERNSARPRAAGGSESCGGAN